METGDPLIPLSHSSDQSVLLMIRIMYGSTADQVYRTQVRYSCTGIQNFIQYARGDWINRRSVGTKKTKFLSAQVQSDRISIAIRTDELRVS